MSKPTSTLPCSACGHQNEPERVYCHNCGQKLDRSLLPQSEEGSKQSRDQDLKRVRKMMSVKGTSMFKYVRVFIQVLVFAAVVAAVFLVCLTPEAVPSTKDTLPDNTDIGLTWQQLMERPQPTMVPFSEIDVNYYLKKTLKSAEGTIPGVKFERAYLRFQPGAITVIGERNVWGLPIYTSMTFVPVVKDGGVRFDVTSVRYGRLGLDPSLKSVGAYGLAAIEKAFAKEIKQAERLSDVKVGEGTIQVTTKPAP